MIEIVQYVVNTHFQVKMISTWLNSNAALIVISNILKVEKNDGIQAGGQKINYLILANYLLQEDYI